MLYYLVTAYICDPQPGEYTGLHSSGPIYIVEPNGSHSEVKVGDCFLSRARSPGIPGNPIGNVLGYDVVWKTVSLQWHPIYSALNAGPRSRHVCCDYWDCTGTYPTMGCVHVMGLPPPPPVITYETEFDCLNNCGNVVCNGPDPGCIELTPGHWVLPSTQDPSVGISTSTHTPLKPTYTGLVGINDPFSCIKAWVCPCGWDYYSSGTGPSPHFGGNPGYCVTPDYGWQDPITGAGPGANQITGSSDVGCITVNINGVPHFPQVGNEINWTFGGSPGYPPGITVSNGPHGQTNGGFITHDSSYITELGTPQTASHGDYLNVSCNSMFPYIPLVSTPNNKKIITLFTLNDSYLSATQSVRDFAINGDEKATFSLTITNAAGEYYNFESNAFQAGGTKLAQAQIDSTGVYKGIIKFPAVSSDDQYDIKLFSEPGYNTHFIENIISITNANVTTSSKYQLNKSIIQYSDTIITYSLQSPGASAIYNTLPSAETSTGKPYIAAGIGSNITTAISWTVTLSSRNFVINRIPELADFETSRSNIYTTDGTGSSSTSLILDDVSNLVEGLSLTAVESGSVAGSPTISSINTNTKTVTLSVAQSWADDKEITFMGTGVDGANLYSASFNIDKPDSSLDTLSNFSVALNDVTTTCDAVAGSTTVGVASASGLKASSTTTNSTETAIGYTTKLTSASGLWIGQYLVNLSTGMQNEEIKIVSIVGTTVTFDKKLTSVLASGTTFTFANSTLTGIGVNGPSDTFRVPVYVTNISGTDLTVNTALTLENTQTLTFKGTSRSATITGTIYTTKIGTTNFTTYLNLDNVLTVTA